MSQMLLVASSDEHFRETVRDNMANVPNARLLAEYPEVASNLYIRVLQDLERHPEAGLIFDLASDAENGMKILEKIKQAVPDLYVIASDYHAEGETVIAALRAGANDFLTQPLRRLDFRDALARFERAPRREHGQTHSRLGKVWTFLGVKGGVGTTTMAVNFAAVLSQRKHSTVLLDLDWTAADCASQLGVQPQYTLIEVGENLERMDQALFEGYVTRDPVGFFFVGPPDSLETQGYFSEPMFRDFSNFLVEKYEHIVIDAGRSVQNEVVFGALQVSSSIMLVMNQDFQSVRNAQRYLSYLMRLGFSQDQIRIVMNQYQKKTGPHQASLDQIQQTLNQPVFFGVPGSPAVAAAINRARPFVVDRQAAGELDATFRRFVDKATGREKELTRSA
ncbi:MAG: AAA family ATPase [Bryobacterales bacterium]|nr:AAA family ATPase [Bryobacterales bacterium]